MYVCVCNGLTTRQVRAAAATCSSTGGVYRALGRGAAMRQMHPDASALRSHAVHQERVEELASGTRAQCDKVPPR